LIFSKLKSGYWPNVNLVAQKCAAIIEESAAGRDVTNLLAGMSPFKGGATSAKKSRRGGSPSKVGMNTTNGFNDTAGSAASGLNQRVINDD
jgi:hypothetical protein